MKRRAVVSSLSWCFSSFVHSTERVRVSPQFYSCPHAKIPFRSTQKSLVIPSSQFSSFPDSLALRCYASDTENKPQNVTPHHHLHGYNAETLSQELHKFISNSSLFEDPVPTNGEEAWERLKRGNELFASGHYGGYLLRMAKFTSKERLTKVAGGTQVPVIVVTCSDSRVPPELIFNQGLGEMFVVRLAGGVLDGLGLATIDFLVERFGPKLILVMGHQRCIAVQTAIETFDSKKHSAGHHHHHEDRNKDSQTEKGSIMEKIYPAVCAVKEAPDEDRLCTVTKENTKRTKEELLSRCAIAASLVKEGKLSILVAHYSLDTGRVSLLS